MQYVRNSLFSKAISFITCSWAIFWEIIQSIQQNFSRTALNFYLFHCPLCPSSSLKCGRSWWSATSKTTTLRKLRSWSSHLAACVARLPWLPPLGSMVLPLIWQVMVCRSGPASHICFGGIGIGIFTCCIVSGFLWIQKVVHRRMESEQEWGRFFFCNVTPLSQPLNSLGYAGHLSKTWGSKFMLLDEYRAKCSGFCFLWILWCRNSQVETFTCLAKLKIFHYEQALVSHAVDSWSCRHVMICRSNGARMAAIHLAFVGFGSRNTTTNA